VAVGAVTGRTASSSASSAAIALRGVRVDYGGGAPPVVCDSLDVGPGLTLVVGPNGAGKSTLLRVAAGVERPAAGEARVRGRDLWRDEVAARRPLAYVPEHPELSPYAAVGEVVRLAARLRGAGDADADAALARVGLDALWHRTVRELSMGQRRRALLAAALVGAPDVLVLDEPLESMDAPTRALVVDWVGGVCAGGGTALLATHDLAPFAELAVAAVVVRGGGVSATPPLPPPGAERLAALRALAG
jgi:ABC-type multidrug transport system ATPase subunit